MKTSSMRIPILASTLSLLALCILFGTANAGESKLIRYTLANGLNVIVKKDTSRKVAAIQIWVNVGSADEDQSTRGISHLIEHMAFKGTKKRGAGKIAKEIEALGGSTNAYTSWDRTVFLVTVPADKVIQGLDILTDAVLDPLISPEELEREKKVVLEEILEGEERPERKAFKLLFETAYTKSPYKFPVIGYKETVSSFSRDDIMAFRKQWYVPQNMFLIIVGDVNPESLVGEIEKMTRSLRPSTFVQKRRPVEPPQEQPRYAILRDANSRETRLNVAFHIPPTKSVQTNALDLAADILGARDSSRLVQALKKQKQLVHSISAYAVTPRDPGLFVVSATLDSENLEAAIRGIMEEIQKLGEEPPAQEELQRAKTHIESSHLYGRQTVGGIARTLGTYESDRGDAEFADVYLKLNTAVTEGQVSSVVRRYLRPPNATVTVLMPEKASPDFRVEQVSKVIDAYTADKTLYSKEPSGEKTVTHTLQNGTRVVLVPDSSNPVVSFRIACLGGKRYETEKTNGIMNFTAQMLDKGTKSLNEVEIARKIEAMGARMSTFSGYDSVGLDATFLRRNVEEGLKLLAEIYTSPSFPQDKLDRERKLILNRIKTAPDRPIQFALKALNETVYSHHPYRLYKEGSLEAVNRFTRKDLVETHRKYFVPSNTVITAVGSMNVKQVMNTLTELFGELPPGKVSAPNIALEESPKHVRENTITLPRAKAHLAIGFHGATLDNEDRYALDVLNSIFSGMGGRLFRELRDKESLAYTVTSFSRVGKDPGVFGFYIGTDRSNADRALSGLIREIERIRQAEVTDEELSRAVNNVIGRHKIALQTPWSRAESIALNDLYGLGYDYDPKYIEQISQVTAKQVREVALKYLDPERAAIVKILPEEKG